MSWRDKLLKFAEIAYNTGQKLEFFVVKRQNQRKWRISLTKLEAHGEDEVDDED